MWFDSLARRYESSTDREHRMFVISRALKYPDVVLEKIEEHKNGWHGTAGNFARVLARMLSQMD